MYITLEWWLVIAFFGSITVIEVVPIKINPWSKFFSWIGNAMLGDFKEDMLTFKKEQEAKNANDMRWSIINFANSCRRGEQHSKDAWCHVLNQIREYEKYTDEHDIVNGVVDADSEYLHRLYEDRCMKNDFIK